MVLVLGLLATPAPAAASPGETTPGQLYTNDGNTFQAGLNPSTFQGGYQGTCDKGDALSLTGTKSYQDIGKVYWAGTIGELADKGVSYHADSDNVVANIWVDTSHNVTFFAWNGNVFSGLGGDDFGALGTVRDIKGATPVSAANGGTDTWTGVHTLSDLSTKVGPTTKVGIWVGISGQAPQMGSISSFAGRPLLAEKGCPLGGGLAPNSGPDSASSGPNQVSTFIRGYDNALWYRSWDGTDWSPWRSLGGILTADPGAASNGDRTDVFVRGADNALWHIGGTGGAFSGWQKISGLLTSGPDAAAWTPGRIDVFARGTDNALYHLAGDGTAWSGWERLGGYLTSEPGVASWGPNRIDIFVRGWDYSAWHLAWNGTAWTGWSSLGGYLTSSPDAASGAPNTLDVSALGPSQTLFHATGNGSAWSGWQPLGGQWTGNPSAVSPRESAYADYFTRGTDGALYWNTQPLP